MIQSIAFFAYPVTDMAKARDFYESALGLKVTMEFDGKWIEYDLGDSTFAITAMDTNHRPGAKGGTVGFEVADLDAFVQQLKDKGVPLTLEITASPVCRFAIFADPDGNEVILHKRHAA